MTQDTIGVVVRMFNKFPPRQTKMIHDLQQAFAYTANFFRIE